jgi:hypothetical protein
MLVHCHIAILRSVPISTWYFMEDGLDVQDAFHCPRVSPQISVYADSWSMWNTSTVSLTPSDLQQPNTDVVNQVDITSVKFRVLRNSDSKSLVVARRVSNCTPLDGMLIPQWNTKIKFLESDSVVSHLFHACSCYQTIDLGHLASITRYSWNQNLSRLFQHKQKCWLKTDAVLSVDGVSAFSVV